MLIKCITILQSHCYFVLLEKAVITPVSVWELLAINELNHSANWQLIVFSEFMNSMW